MLYLKLYVEFSLRQIQSEYAIKKIKVSIVMRLSLLI